MRWSEARERRWRVIVVAIAAFIFIYQWVRIVRAPQADFPVHYAFAERFVRGDFLYENGLNTPYAPFWAMWNAPLTSLPMHAAQIAVYPASGLLIAALVLVLRRLTSASFPLTSRQSFWAITLSIALASRFLTRDLADCGLNTGLALLTWFAVWCWTERRDVLGGFSLGLAIALKWTPALFLAYFVWKRQWRFAAATLLATALFSLAPMLRLGPAEYARSMRVWAGSVATGVSQTDPSRGVLGEDNFKNLSLRPALARFLMTLHAGHAGRVDHPLHFDFLHLPPRTAGLIIKGVLVALGLTVAWFLRGPIRDRKDPRVVWACASLSLGMLLLSPITWRAHCVAVLPACFLLTHLAFTRRGLPPAVLTSMCFYVVFGPLLSRDLLGRELSFLLDGYRVLTWALLALLAATLAGMRLTFSPPPPALPRSADNDPHLDPAAAIPPAPSSNR